MEVFKLYAPECAYRIYRHTYLYLYFTTIYYDYNSLKTNEIVVEQNKCFCFYSQKNTFSILVITEMLSIYKIGNII